MNLVTTDQEIRIVLGEAMTTNDCDITTSYGDFDGNNFLLGANPTRSDGTTPVVAVPAPPAGNQRQVKEIRLFNNDTVLHTVTMDLFDGADSWVIGAVPTPTSVPPGGSFVYTPEAGITVSGTGGGGGTSLTVQDDTGDTITSVGTLEFVGVKVSGSTPSAITNMTTITGSQEVGTVAATGVVLRGGAGGSSGTVTTGANVYSYGGAGGAGSDYSYGGFIGGTGGAGGSGTLKAFGGGVAFKGGEGGPGPGQGNGGAVQFGGGLGHGTGAGGSSGFYGGSADGSGDGGGIVSYAGGSVGSGNGGNSIVRAGSAGPLATLGLGGSIALYSGPGGSGTTLTYGGRLRGEGGSGGDGTTFANGGQINFVGGAGGTAASYGLGGGAIFQGGPSYGTAPGGKAGFYGGYGAGTGDGGDVIAFSGAALGGGAGGKVKIAFGSGATPGELDVNNDPSLIVAAYSWVAGALLNNQTIFTTTRSMIVTAVIGRPDAANGSAATLTVVKAASGTAPAGGTALTSTSMDLDGAPDTNQTLTLSVTLADITLAPGDSLCMTTTGVLTLSAGCITVWGTPQ